MASPSFFNYTDDNRYMNLPWEEMNSILSLTPKRIDTIINQLTRSQLEYKPNPDHFSITEVIGHLVHGEDTDWIPRLQLMLNHSQDENIPRFEPFDRFAQDQFIENYTPTQLAELFSSKRKENLQILEGLQITDNTLKIEGMHPSLGKVNVEWLLNCWVAHDLSHINQINRIMVHKFSNVGPWDEYLRILSE